MKTRTLFMTNNNLEPHELKRRNFQLISSKYSKLLCTPFGLYKSISDLNTLGVTFERLKMVRS